MEFVNRITLYDKEQPRVDGHVNRKYVGDYTAAAISATQATIQNWISADKERKLKSPRLMLSCDRRGLVINMIAAEDTVLACSQWFSTGFNLNAFNAAYRAALTSVGECWAREDFSSTFVVTEGGVEKIPSVL
jgi:hypothetical protein